MAQNQVYNVLDSLKAQLLQHPQCNTVTTGNLSDVDLAKTTIFPLTHLIVDTTTLSSRTIPYSDFISIVEKGEVSGATLDGEQIIFQTFLFLCPDNFLQ